MLKIFYGKENQDLLSFLFSRIDLKGRTLVIVPAQFTLACEEAAFEKLGAKGFLDLHIMSDNKLAQEIVRECGGMGATAINSIGRNMMLRKIAKDHADELSAYKDIARDPAFLELAGDFIVQLKQNNIAPEELSTIAASAAEGGILSRKLSDMQLICTAFQSAMEGKYSDSEDLRKYVTSRVKDCSFVKDSEVWFYDFYSFTLRDAAFVTELAKYCRNVNIVMPGGSDKSSKYDVTRRALGQFKTLVADAGVNYAAEEVLEFERKTADEIHIVRCANPFTQAETIAAEILKLVRERGYEADDIAVLTGADSGQAETIKRILKLWDIPVFVDEKRSVLHNPAIETICALLDMAADGIKTESVLKFLKPGYSGLAERELIEEFDNYTRQYHINDRKLSAPFKYGKTQFETCFDDLEKLRVDSLAKIKALLSPFKAGKTAKEKCEALYIYLAETLELPQLLESNANDLADCGIMDEIETLSQIWNKFIELLDQVCELIGDEEISAGEFRDIIKNALADVEVGILPQAEGRVTLGSVGRSRIKDVKALFIAGVNDGIIPSDINKEGILTQRELDKLEASGYVLSKSNIKLAQEERLVISNVLAAPSDYLWLGYPVADANGEELKPSSLIADIKATHQELAEEDDCENSDYAEAFIQSASGALKPLTQQLRAYLSGEPLAEEWQAAYNSLKESDGRIAALRSGLFFKNKTGVLSKSNRQALFGGDEPVISPSRIENFAACPFRHFVAYGLRPDEQRDFDITNLEIGSTSHECMRRFSELLSAPCRSRRIAISSPESPWMTITHEEIASLIDKILDELSDEYLDGVLKSGKAEEYRSERIRNVCVRFGEQLVRQVRQGEINDMYFETNFGKGTGKRFPEVRINTSLGDVRIEGKIDRIDLLSGPKERVRIIDYKTGKKTLNKDAAEQGFTIQLMVYLEGVLAAKVDSEPSGVYYWQIHDPANNKVALSDLNIEKAAEATAEEFAKEYKFNGMQVTADPDVKSTSSMLYVSAEEFEEFRTSVKRGLSEVCKRLLSGNIDINPRKTPGADKLPCEYCNYKDICIKD